jgi:hypothetical protein
VWILVEDINEGVDFLIGNDSILISEIVKDFFKFAEMFHVSDFSPDHFIVEICENTDQEGQNDVIQDEHDGE